MNEKNPGGIFMFPEAASSLAGSVDALYIGLIISSLLVVILIFALILFFSIRYRSGAIINRHIEANPKRDLSIEILWTILVAIAFIIFFLWSAGLYIRLYPQALAGQEINVIARQWMWKFQHASGAREINELHVPVDTPVVLRMTSQDVIHSFFVPAFRIKQDVLPNTYTTLTFTAIKPGKYHLFCTEYCGLDHSKMVGSVYVLSKPEYQRWIQTQPEAQTLARSGQALFQSYGCSGCHRPEGVVPAPLLAGIYGKAVPLSDGSTVIADDQYLRDSILLPQKHIAAGFAPVMPSFQGQIDESDLFKLIAYLKSLTLEDQLE